VQTNHLRVINLAENELECATLLSLHCKAAGACQSWKFGHAAPIRLDVLGRCLHVCVHGKPAMAQCYWMLTASRMRALLVRVPPVHDALCFVNHAWLAAVKNLTECVPDNGVTCDAASVNVIKEQLALGSMNDSCCRDIACHTM
jgi:hypothetical protein